MTQSYSLIERLAKHLQRPVDEATRARARLHLLDWLACVAGARGSRVGKIGSLSLPGAAGPAALLGNVLEMDDIHRGALLHPGPVIWAACMHHTPEAMTEMLDMAVRGYEAMIAVGATFDAHHYAYWHPTATAGAIGAAAAVSSYYSPDYAEGAAWAMANTASVSGGLWHLRHDDVMTKQWHILHAVRTGGEAAWLAMDGLTGPLAILEGPQGVYEAMCKAPKPMLFPPQWRIHEVSFKPWAACRHVHPAIDCALELRAAGNLAPPFHVETYTDAITFCDQPHPTTEAEAKFSLQHGVALIADGRNAEPQDFTPDAVAALAALRAQVTVSEASEITARYPEHFGARVNGLELVDTRGDPERPVSQADIIAKVRTLVAWGGLPPQEADRAVELALRGQSSTAITEMLQEWLS
jgi:2-methylcitrate dehydratase PrpD